MAGNAVVDGDGELIGAGVNNLSVKTQGYDALAKLAHEGKDGVDVAALVGDHLLSLGDLCLQSVPRGIREGVVLARTILLDSLGSIDQGLETGEVGCSGGVHQAQLGGRGKVANGLGPNDLHGLNVILAIELEGYRVNAIKLDRATSNLGEGLAVLAHLNVVSLHIAVRTALARGVHKAVNAHRRLRRERDGDRQLVLAVLGVPHSANVAVQHLSSNLGAALLGAGNGLEARGIDEV